MVGDGKERSPWYLGFWSASRFIKSLAVALVIALLAGVTVCFIKRPTDPDFFYNSLGYDVQVLDNGDLHIRQIIDAHLNRREDSEGYVEPWIVLSQRYKIDATRLKGISQVSVRDLDAHSQYKEIAPFSNTSEVRLRPFWYQVWADNWYMAKVDGNSFSPYRYDTAGGTARIGKQVQTNCSESGGYCTLELGWYIQPIDSAEHRRFQVDMTLHGVTTAYKDVATFTWEPVGRNNRIRIDSLNAVVHMPAGINRYNSKAWLHNEGNSEVGQDQDGTLRFSVRHMEPGQSLDLVSMFDVAKTNSVERRDGGRAKDAIVKEETSAFEQSRRREKKLDVIRLAFGVLAILFALILVVVLLRLAFTTYRDSRYRGQVIYYRDPPDTSPASAEAFNDILEDRKTNSGDQLSTTILSLASKKAISLQPGSLSQEKKEELPSDSSPKHAKDDRQSVIITLNEQYRRNPESFHLWKSERSAMDLLQAAAGQMGDQVDRFDMNQLSDSLGDCEKAPLLMEDFKKATDDELHHLTATVSRPWLNCLGILTILFAIAIAFLDFLPGNALLRLTMSLVLIAVSVFALCYGRTEVLTPEGRELAGQVEGLRHYLLDFSSFEDRGVEDLPLWEQYLVYASAFGISDRVTKQLVMIYPDLTDTTWLENNASDSLVYPAFVSISQPGGLEASSGNGQGDLQPTTGSPELSSDLADFGSRLAEDFHEVLDSVRSASEGGGEAGADLAGGSGGSGNSGGGPGKGSSSAR